MRKHAGRIYCSESHLILFSIPGLNVQGNIRYWNQVDYDYPVHICRAITLALQGRDYLAKTIGQLLRRDNVPRLSIRGTIKISLNLF